VPFAELFRIRIGSIAMDYRCIFPALFLAACSQGQDHAAVPDDGVNQVATDPFANESANATLPDDRTPIEDPNGAIDPTSAEAAGQVVQSFGALIEQKRWAEAESLWGDAATASKFTADLKRNRESHLEIGRPGDPEGAAGSIYVTMPIIFYGKTSVGAGFRRGADVILRRVNDVPGSSEAQRRWHIERIELKA
jgi:hypothetical protein